MRTFSCVKVLYVIPAAEPLIKIPHLMKFMIKLWVLTTQQETDSAGREKGKHQTIRAFFDMPFPTIDKEERGFSRWLNLENELLLLSKSTGNFNRAIMPFRKSYICSFSCFTMCMCRSRPTILQKGGAGAAQVLHWWLHPCSLPPPSFFLTYQNRQTAPQEQQL